MFVLGQSTKLFGCPRQNILFKKKKEEKKKEKKKFNKLHYKGEAATFSQSILRKEFIKPLSLIKPVILYGAETWTLMKNVERSYVETFENF